MRRTTALVPAALAPPTTSVAPGSMAVAPSRTARAPATRAIRPVARVDPDDGARHVPVGVDAAADVDRTAERESLRVRDGRGQPSELPQAIRVRVELEDPVARAAQRRAAGDHDPGADGGDGGVAKPDGSRATSAKCVPSRVR